MLNYKQNIFKLHDQNQRSLNIFRISKSIVTFTNKHIFLYNFNFVKK